MPEKLQRPIRFKFAADKARAALIWILTKHESVDLHACLKTFYFAEKDHLNKHARPIVGATYKAMKYGPVPLEIYEMIKCEPYWVAELSDHEPPCPWKLDWATVKRRKSFPTGNDVTELLSANDIKSLEAALKKSVAMTFTERTAATHGEDWQKANLGIIDYEDMIEDTPQKEKLVETLRDTGRFLRL